MLYRPILFLLLTFVAGVCRADCFDDAGALHGVNPWILRAIAARESNGRADAVHRNTNGTEDYGYTQTNSKHLPELASLGVSKSDLFDACKSVYVAGWLVQKKIRRWGNTCYAIGAYHSETPAKRDAYIRQLQQILYGWGVVWTC